MYLNPLPPAAKTARPWGVWAWASRSSALPLATYRTSRLPLELLRFLYELGYMRRQRTDVFAV